MAAQRVRFVERSYKSLVLDAEPDFYEKSAPINTTVYEFSNGRRFMARRLYDNYFPMEFPIIDQGLVVSDEGVMVTQEITVEEYEAEFAV